MLRKISNDKKIGKLNLDFKAGEIYNWDSEDLHAAVNSGFDPRYTLLLYLSKQTA